MKRVGLAVGFAFLILVASQCFTDPAYADAPNFPPLTPIQEDDAVPEIAKYKELYERVTASDWQPAVTVTASVKNSQSKRYPKADFFCKQIKTPAEIQFVAKPKPGTDNFVYARVTSIDCVSQPGAALMTGVFIWNNGHVWAGEVSAVDRELNYVYRAGALFQNVDKTIVVYRASAQGVEIAAVAGPQGATLLATGGDTLFGFDWLPTGYGDYYSAPLAKVPARLIIPGMGYFEGRSSAFLGEAFRVGGYERYGNNGYGAFYAPDDSFRIIGAIWNEGAAYDPNRPSSVEYAKPDFPEAQKPETLVVDLISFCTSAAACSGSAIDAWLPTKNYFYMASCAEGTNDGCRALRVETRVPTVLGPPGKYEYVGVVDLTKAPDLSKMLSPKWDVNYLPEPMTAVQHFPNLYQPAPSQEQTRQGQAKRDQHFQTKLEQVEAYWAVDDKVRIDMLADIAQSYGRASAEWQAHLEAERQAEARRQAETAAAIMGAFADLSQSAIASAEDLNETRALVDRTNAASAGGFVARNTPYVAPQLTEEQRQLLASRWGRSGGKSVSTAGSGQGYSGTSVSGSSSASDADEPKRITQAEVEAIMTSRIFVTEDGTPYTTNGRYVNLGALASDRFWSPFIQPVSDMEVTSFDETLNSAGQSWNLQGRGICTHYLDMRDVPVGEKLKDEQTGGPALFVGECTWNFVNDGASTNYYRFNANDGALFGSSPK
jgi:hypothetical protein